MLLVIAITKRNLHQRQNCRVTLLAALEREQVIVSATLTRGKLTTCERPRAINRAATGFGIKKLARFAEDGILFAAQNLLALPGCGETLFGDGVINREMSRQAFDVARRDLHALVDRAAVRRTARTVVVTSFGWFS